MAKQNNDDFAAKDKVFKEACSMAGCQPTKRQASKFRLGRRGLAILYKNEAKKKVQSKEKN